MNRDPLRSNTILNGTFFTAVVSGAAAWLFGVSIPNALLVSLAVLLIGVSIAVISTEPARLWHRLSRGARYGSRTELNRLSWAVGRKEVRPSALKRLITIAEARLVSLGISLDDEVAARRVLGDRAYSVLGADLDQIEYRQFVSAVNALEQLDPQPPGTYQWQRINPK